MDKIYFVAKFLFSSFCSNIYTYDYYRVLLGRRVPIPSNSPLWHLSEQWLLLDDVHLLSNPSATGKMWHKVNFWAD